ncbi:MAG: hypothetical protein ABWY00_12060 [Dongiaceae bacterium]
MREWLYHLRFQLLQAAFPRSIGLAFCLTFMLSLTLGCQQSFEPLPLAQGPQTSLPPSDYEFLPAGTVVVWRNLDTGRIEEQHILNHIGRLYQATWAGKRSFAYLPDTWADNENTREADIEPLFPMQVGKKVAFYRQPAGGRTHDRVEVIRAETLSLEIGKVDTFVIETQSQQLADGWSGRALVWYAPALRTMVQVEITDTDGDHRRRQLIAIKTH